MYIIIIHQFGNAKTAVVAVDPDSGDNLLFETHSEVNVFAEQAGFDLCDFTVLEV